MKKIASLCIGSILMLSLFTTGVNAASQNFSFYFNGAFVEGDTNGIFYEIGANNASVTAKGSWRMKREYTTGSQSATCSIALKRVTLFTDENFGFKSIGSASVANGYYSGSYTNFDISWTSGTASDEYYLMTSCGSSSGGAYKDGNGTLSW